MTIKRNAAASLLRLTCAIGISALSPGCASEGMDSEYDGMDSEYDVPSLEGLEPVSLVDLEETLAEEEALAGGEETLVDKASLSNGSCYRFASVNANSKYLAVHGASNADGANVIVWQLTGNKDTTWKARDQGGGSVSLWNMNSGKALRWDSSKGGNITQSKTTDSWEILQPNSSKNEYVISSTADGNCVDVERWGTHNGANVHAYQWHGGKNQLWKISPVSCP